MPDGADHQAQIPAVPPEQTSPSLDLRRRFLSWPTLVSFLVAGALLFLLVTRLDLDLSDIFARLRAAHMGYFFLALLIHFTTFLFRGARWRALLRNVRDPGERMLPAWRLGVIILVSWFANSVTFFRLGDAYRAYAYSQETGQSASRTMGTVLAERILDVVLVFLVMGVAVLAMAALPGVARPSPLFMLLALGLVGAVAAGLTLMLTLKAWIAGLLPRRLQGMYERFHHGTMASFRMRRLPGVLALGALGWASEMGRLYFVLKALNVDLATPWVIFVTLANALLTLVPITPGGLGVVEPGIGGLLALSLTKETAISVALLDRAISYGAVVAIGGGAFLVRQAMVRTVGPRTPRPETRAPVGGRQRDAAPTLPDGR